MTLRVILLFALMAAGCREGEPSAGSNSNWLVRCTADDDCSASTACHCGSCTRRCAVDADCENLASGACVASAEPSVRSLCRDGGDDVALCLPRCAPGDCDAAQVCVLGACVLARAPATDLCAGVAPANELERTREDELLEAIEQATIQGGIRCGNTEATPPRAPLRFDPRLTCAARVLAADMNATRRRSLVDSQGRRTVERLSGADYSASSWGEAFSFAASSASGALEQMLSDAEACTGLTAAGVRDVGVARVGDVDVVTVAAE